MDSDIMAVLAIFVGFLLIAIVMIRQNSRQQKIKEYELIRKEREAKDTAILNAQWAALNRAARTTAKQNHTKNNDKTYNNPTVTNKQYVRNSISSTTTVNDDSLTNVFLMNAIINSSTPSYNCAPSHSHHDSSSSSSSSYCDTSSSSSSSYDSSSSSSSSSYDSSSSSSSFDSGSSSF